MSHDFPRPRDVSSNHLAFLNPELEQVRELVRDIQMDVEDVLQALASVSEGKGEQGIEKAERLRAAAQEFENELDDLHIHFPIPYRGSI